MTEEVMPVYTILRDGSVTDGVVISGYAHRRSEGQFAIIGVGERRAGAWLGYMKASFLDDETYDRWDRGMHDIVFRYVVFEVNDEVSEEIRARNPHDRYFVCEADESEIKDGDNKAFVVVLLPIYLGRRMKPFGRGDEVFARGRLQGPNADPHDDGGQQAILTMTEGVPVTFPLYPEGRATYVWTRADGLRKVN